MMVSYQKTQIVNISERKCVIGPRIKYKRQAVIIPIYAEMLFMLLEDLLKMTNNNNVKMNIGRD